VVKQSAALCLLRLYRALPDLTPSGEWTSRIIHLLNDQHMVRLIYIYIIELMITKLMSILGCGDSSC